MDRVEDAREQAERNATFSSCCGFLGEVTLTDSAVIILFAGMLGAGDMFSIIATSFLPLLNGLLVLPFAWAARRLGSKRLILWACSFAFMAYLLAVVSPEFGHCRVAALLGAILLFAACQTGFIAGWFPMLDTFLTRERRAAFFGRMRFPHQVTAVVFLAVVGAVIGRQPPLWALQVVLLIGALVFAGRILFIARIPESAALPERACGFRAGLMAAIANKPLVGFSLYLLILNAAAFGTVPLATVFLKNRLHAADNVIVLISATTLAGMIAGYFFAPRLVARTGVRATLLVVHASYAAVNLGLFLSGTGGAATLVFVAAILFVYSFMMAAASVVSSAEMMALASPGNKTVAMAFCGALGSTGAGAARVLSSLVLGSGMLADGWRLGGMSVSHYQTFFLIYAGMIAFAAAFLLIVPAVFPHAANREPCNHSPLAEPQA